MLYSNVIQGSNILEVTYDGALGADEMAGPSTAHPAGRATAAAPAPSSRPPPR